jgi:hypothetical protein
MRATPLKTLLLAMTSSVMLIAPAVAVDCSLVKSTDADTDGKIELGEVKKAASAAWKKITSDADRQAVRKEFEVRLGSKELAEGTGGGGVTEKEYVEIAASLFAAVDVDKEGSIDCGEIASDAGKVLEKMLK